MYDWDKVRGKKIDSQKNGENPIRFSFIYSCVILVNNIEAEKKAKAKAKKEYYNYFYASNLHNDNDVFFFFFFFFGNMQ